MYSVHNSHAHKCAVSACKCVVCVCIACICAIFSCTFIIYVGNVGNCVCAVCVAVFHFFQIHSQEVNKKNVSLSVKNTAAN